VNAIHQKIHLLSVARLFKDALLVHFPMVFTNFPVVRVGIGAFVFVKGDAKQIKNKTGKSMRVKLLVQTQEFQSWPATKDRAASTSHNLVCVDMSQPADARMTESISYRLKDEEIPKHWDKAMDKIIEVNLRRIAHSKSGKASIIGEIVESTPAK